MKWRRIDQTLSIHGAECTKSTSALSTMTADLKTFIKRAMARGEHIDVGQFRLLNLTAVREQAGENWPSVRKRVFTTATQFLAKRIGKDDAVLPCEEGFLVFFATAPDDPATFLAELSDALTAFFLGGPETTAIAVEGEASQVSAGEIQQLAAPPSKPVASAPAAKPDAPRKSAVDKRPLPRSRPVSECEDDSIIAHYRPLWDAARQAMAANACLAKVVIGGRALEGRRAIATHMSKVSHADLDNCVAATAVEVIQTLLRKQKRMMLRIALHETSLADRDSRKALIKTIERLPETARKILLVRIDGLSDAPAAQAAALTELGELGVRLMAELQFGDTEIADFANCDVSLFSCASPAPSNANSEGLMDHDARALNEMVRAAAALKAATYLHDVRDLHVLKAAMASGVRFFSGQAVIEDRATPAPAKPLSMVDLIRMNKAA